MALAKKFLGKFIALVLTLIVALSALAVATSLGWLDFIGLRIQSHDTQVIRTVHRTQEVSLVSLAVQGIKEKKVDRSVMGRSIPGTGQKTFIQYVFDAKLGLDGSKVKVARTAPKAYRITVPEFIRIGYSDPAFKVAAKDGSLLSWITPNIDETQMINEILNDDAWKKYIDDNRELLQDQTKSFYDSLITSIDPEIKTSYVFNSP